MPPHKKQKTAPVKVQWQFDVLPIKEPWEPTVLLNKAKEICEINNWKVVQNFLSVPGFIFEVPSDISRPFKAEANAWSLRISYQKIRASKKPIPITAPGDYKENLGKEQASLEEVAQAAAGQANDVGGAEEEDEDY